VLLVIYFGCTTNQRSIPFGCLLQLLVQGIRDPFCFCFSGVSSVFPRDAAEPGECGSGVFVTEEVRGAGDKASGDTARVCVETLLEAFLADFQAWDYFPKMYQHFWHISISIKGIVLHFTTYIFTISAPLFTHSNWETLNGFV
jgi:hypothetical protein